MNLKIYKALKIGSNVIHILYLKDRQLFFSVLKILFQLTFISP